MAQINLLNFIKSSRNRHISIFSPTFPPNMDRIWGTIFSLLAIESSNFYQFFQRNEIEENSAQFRQNKAQKIKFLPFDGILYQ